MHSIHEAAAHIATKLDNSVYSFQGDELHLGRRGCRTALVIEVSTGDAFTITETLHGFPTGTKHASTGDADHLNATIDLAFANLA
jgi:hypothetical protein